MAAFPCSIVTPSESVLSVDATYVSFPAWDGQKGVLAGASSFLAQLGVGVATIEVAGGAAKVFLLEGGFAQMQNGKLTLVTDQAIERSSIDRGTAEREVLEANMKVVEPGHTDPDERSRLERAQQLAMAKVGLARG